MVDRDDRLPIACQCQLLDVPRSTFYYARRDVSIRISMDGKGRWVDNVFVERPWRSLKYDEVYLKAYESIAQARTSIGQYLAFNTERRH